MGQSLVFDIETTGQAWDSLDEITQHLLLEKQDGADSDAALLAAKDQLGFTPYTGQVVSICAIDADTGRGGVYFQAGDQVIDEEHNGVKYKSMSEIDMLQQFWNLAGQYRQFVTFFGRGFDVPFLMVRSAIHEIRPTKDLMRGRYLYQQQSDAQHIDLYDQMSFYGATKVAKLHIVCEAFGIKGPKQEGVDGAAVHSMFANGEYRQIADYNVGDVVATAELFRKWRMYLQQ